MLKMLSVYKRQLADVCTIHWQLNESAAARITLQSVTTSVRWRHESSDRCGIGFHILWS